MHESINKKSDRIQTEPENIFSCEVMIQEEDVSESISFKLQDLQQLNCDKIVFPKNERRKHS